MKNRSRAFRTAAKLLPAALVAASVALCSPAPAPAQTYTQLQNASFDGVKRVWVHQLHELPWYDNPNVSPTSGDYQQIYGALYPLTLAQGSYWTAIRRPSDTLQRYLDCGVTGIQHLQHDTSSLLGTIEAIMTSADAYPGFKVAPCINLTEWEWGYTNGVRNFAGFMRDYHALTGSHASGVRLRMNSGGILRSLSFNYGGAYSEEPQYWDLLLTEAEDAGGPPYMINNYAVGPTTQGEPEEYFAVFPADWVFGSPGYSASIDDWNLLIQRFNASNHRLAGGPVPQYNRETPDPNDGQRYGGYNDAEGTARYRREWNHSLGSGLQWVNVTSWNDYSENHQIIPNSDWSWTRGDLTAFYSAKLRGGSNWRSILPSRLKNSAQLYITTAQKIWVGQTGGAARRAEGMVINAGTTPLTLKVQLLDGNGNPWGSERVGSVAAGQASSVTKYIEVASGRIPAKRFLRARARTYNPSAPNTIVQEVLSAPILIYGSQEDTADVQHDRVHYYSTPAYRKLNKPTVSLSGDPRTGARQATVGLPSGMTAGVRFAEVLQNTYQVKNFFNSSSRAVGVPVGARQSEAGTVTTPAAGFYLARVIDENENIGYSDPVYYGPAPSG